MFPIKKVFSWLGSPYYTAQCRSEVPIGSSKSLSHCSVLSDMKLLSFQFWAQQCTFDALLLWLDCPWPKEGRARRTNEEEVWNFPCNCSFTPFFTCSILVFNSSVEPWVLESWASSLADSNWILFRRIPVFCVELLLTRSDNKFRFRCYRFWWNVITETWLSMAKRRQS